MVFERFCSPSKLVVCCLAKAQVELRSFFACDVTFFAAIRLVCRVVKLRLSAIVIDKK